jgi:hypothetical protein
MHSDRVNKQRTIQTVDHVVGETSTSLQQGPGKVKKRKEKKRK